MNSEDNFLMELNDFEEILSITNLIHDFRKADVYWELRTSILLGKSRDYLNLYLIPEDGVFYLSDSNNIYAVLDDYYDVDDEKLSKAANEVGLGYEEYRFHIAVTTETITTALLKYQKAVSALTGGFVS